MSGLPRPVDVLPHRPPFLFVDEVTRLEPGTSATGTWALSGEEWFFAGHFPGRPTLPGVLMCEAIAQVGAIAVLTTSASPASCRCSAASTAPGSAGKSCPATRCGWTSDCHGCRRGPAREAAGPSSGDPTVRSPAPATCSLLSLTSESLGHGDRAGRSCRRVRRDLLAVRLRTAAVRPPDETAHLGYAHEIANLDLPEITEPPEVPDSATQWRAERESGRDDRYRAVWVANHPPLHYVVTAPLIWFSDTTDRPDGGLMLMRLANIAFAAAGVVFTYLLGRDLSGGAPHRCGCCGDRRPRSPGERAVLRSDERRPRVRRGDGGRLGWCPVRRHAVRSVERGDLVVLGVAAAACAGARSATLLVAVVVVVWVVVARWATAPGTVGRRVAPASTVAAYGFVPAAVLFGWYYVRNDRLYGDLAGSEFLLDRFGRIPRGSMFDVLTWGHLWVDLYHMLMSPSPLFTIRAPLSTSRCCSPPWGWSSC